jgi:hypothetical protein
MHIKNYDLWKLATPPEHMDTEDTEELDLNDDPLWDLLREVNND